MLFIISTHVMNRGSMHIRPPNETTVDGVGVPK